jgi:hypothetical protein
LNAPRRSSISIFLMTLLIAPAPDYMVTGTPGVMLPATVIDLM